MSLLPDDPLSLMILLYKNMQNRQVIARTLRGVIGEDIEFESVQGFLEARNLLIAANPNGRTLECHLPNNFFLSLNDVLSIPALRIAPLDRFYLADSDCLYETGEPNIPKLVQYYLSAAKLYSLLEKVVDHQGGVGDKKTLIFLQNGKIEITSQYGVEDLRDLASLNSFDADFIASNTHQEQKQTIVKTALLELFSGRSRVPFAELLNNFGHFFDKVRASYELYVAEFSFQKVKAEVEKEKLEAMVKLNKVFSDIQSQLLAVPVALVLVGGQMEDKSAWTSKNVLIWVGALVFAVLMDLLIRNQRNTLQAVKEEIDQQKQQIGSKYQCVAARFKEVYSEIDKRHKYQEKLISVVDLLVAFSFAVTSFIVVWFSGALPCLYQALCALFRPVLASLLGC